MQPHEFAMLPAPSSLGLESRGVEGLPDRLLELGLARDIHARLAGRQLASVLRIALSSDRAVGLEVAIYNPSLDEDGSAGRALVGMLKEALNGFQPAFITPLG